MRNCLIGKRFLCIFLLFSIVGFLIFPQNILADVELSRYETYLLLNSVQTGLMERWINLTASPDFSEPEKQAAIFLIRNAIQEKELQYILKELPKEFLKKTVEIAAFLLGSPDAGTILEKIEKESVKEAIRIAEEWLQQKEIKVASGTLNYSFTSYKGNKQDPIFYYNLAYHPLTKNSGELSIAFYSPEEIEPPPPTGYSIGLNAFPWEYGYEYVTGKEKIEPFIIKIKGQVSEWEGIGYKWDKTLSIEVTFPEKMPNLPEVKPLTFWEKIQNFFTEKFGFIQELATLFGGGQVAPPEFSEIGTPEENEEEILEIEETVEELSEAVEEVSESELQPIELKLEIEPDSEPKLTLEEIQEILDDISEQVDVITQKTKELVGETAVEPEEVPEIIEGEREEEEEPVGEQEEEEEPPSFSGGYVPDQNLPPLLISEVCAGWDSSANEFIELYNPNDEQVSLNKYNFKLKLINSSNQITTKEIAEFPKTIPAKGYFLLVGGEISGITPNATFSAQLTGSSGVIITDGRENVKDKVSWGDSEKEPPSEAVEGTGIVLESGLTTGKSLERIKNGEELVDTNDNSQDFILNTNPSPTNSSGQTVYLPSEEPEPEGGGEQEEEEEEEEEEEPELEPEYEEIPPLAVVINEVAWMGTKASSNDEWIELYNNTDTDINLENCTLKATDGTPEINLSGTILAGGYYLLERTSDDTISTIEADQIYTGALNDTGEKLELEDGHGNIIDSVDCSGGWFAGDGEGKVSMERVNSNWANNNLITRNGVDADSNNIYGTPKAKNSVSISPTSIYGPNLNSQAFQDFSEITFPLYSSPYLIDGTISVPEGKTLIIEPEVVLKFIDSTSRLEINGTLKAIGEEGNQIIFTKTTETNYWQGIYFSETSTDSELNWIQVEYGKTYEKSASIFVENSSISIKNSTFLSYPQRGLRLKNSSGSLIEKVNFFGPGQDSTNFIGIEIEGGESTVKDSSFQNHYYGIYMPYGTEGMPLIEANNFEENKYPVWSIPQVVFKENQGQNNNTEGIILSGQITNESLILFKNQLPYIFRNIVEVSENKVLTIEPGVMIKFDGNAKLKVKGQLLAQGTLEEPVLFTALTPSSGYRDGIHFFPTSQNSLMENVVVENLGYYVQMKGSEPAIYVENTQVTFTNLTLRNSAKTGMLLENSNSIINNSQFTNNKIGISIKGTDIYPQITNSQFKDNELCDIYWPDGGENCEELKTESTLKVECNCCPY